MPKRKAFSNNEKFSFGLKLLSKMDIVFLLTLLSIATILNYTLADNVYCPGKTFSKLKVYSKILITLCLI